MNAHCVQPPTGQHLAAECPLALVQPAPPTVREHHNAHSNPEPVAIKTKPSAVVLNRQSGRAPDVELAWSRREGAERREVSGEEERSAGSVCRAVFSFLAAHCARSTRTRVAITAFLLGFRELSLHCNRGTIAVKISLGREKPACTPLPTTSKPLCSPSDCL